MFEPKDGSTNPAKIRLTQKAINAIKIVDLVDVGSIFFMTMQEVMRKILQESLKNFAYPILITTNICLTALAWIQVYQQRDHGNLLFRTIIDTFAACAVIAAMIISLFFSAIAAIVSPIIFTVVNASKAFINIACSIYYGIKSALSTEPTQKNAYSKLAIDHAIQGFSATLFCCAVVGAMLIGKTVLAGLGVIAAGLGIAYSVYKLCNLSPRPTQPLVPPLVMQDEKISVDSNEKELPQLCKLSTALTPEKSPFNNENRQREKPLPPNNSGNHLKNCFLFFCQNQVQSTSRAHVDAHTKPAFVLSPPGRTF